MNKVAKKPEKVNELHSAFVREPAAVFRMSAAAIEGLDETSRSIVAVIKSFPWTALNDSVTAAALFSFGISDSLIEYIFELELAQRKKAA